LIGDTDLGSRQSRSALVHTILRSRCLVGVEAGSGYGKTALLRSIAESWEGPVVSSTDDRNVNGEPLPSNAMVLVDDASEADQRFEQATAHARRGGLSVVGARVLPQPFRTAGLPRMFVSPKSLQFGLPEIEDLLSNLFGDDLDDRLARLILANGGEWPVYGRALAEAATMGENPMRELLRAIDASSIVGRIVTAFDALNDEDRSSLVQLSHFPICSDRCFEALSPGGDLLQRARLSGYPLDLHGDGVVDFNPVLRRWLRSQAPLDRDAARRVYPALAGGGDVLVAARVMLVVGDVDAAISLIGGLSASAVEWLPPNDLLSVLEALHSASGADARLSLQLARAYTGLGRLEDGHREYERAASLSMHDSVPRETYAEIRAERLSELAFRDGELVRDEVAEMLATTPPAWVVAWSSLAVAEVAVVARSGADPSEMSRAEGRLLGAVTTLEAIGESLRAARALRVLASTVLSAQFRFREMVAMVRRCEELVRGHPRHSANNLIIGCMSAAMLGDIEAFRSFESEAIVIVDTVELVWQKAYLQWSRMVAAAWAGDRETTRACRQAAEELLGQILTQPTGTTFYALAAEALARVGDESGARADLARARDRRDQNETQFRFAELVVSVRFDAPDRAIALGTALLDDRATPPAKRWRVMAELALASARKDDNAECCHWSARVRAEAAACGDTILEHHLHPSVRVVESMPAISVSTTLAATLEIDVMGRFEVRRDGRTVEIPPGHVDVLVKLLAVRGGSVTVDMATDLLWPDADIEVARRRLKNVLMRVRTVLGPGWVDRTASSVCLHPEVGVDQARFEAAARRAHVLAVARDHEAIEACLGALELVRGSVLPSDLYSDWADDARGMIRSRALTLVDLVLAAPIQQQISPRLLDALLRIDPDAQTQLIGIARRAEAEQNHATFRAAAFRAKAVGDALDLPPTASLRELLSRV
jgi:DNA-binding SARP family transcriptional activator